MVTLTINGLTNKKYNYNVLQCYRIRKTSNIKQKSMLVTHIL